MKNTDLKEQIRIILQKRLDAISSEFDDYLCYRKYGVERFLSEGFQPTDEDFKVRKSIVEEQLAAAGTEIEKMGEDFKPILKEIAEKDSNPDVRDWASKLL